MNVKMDAFTKSVNALLDIKAQYKVPLYQRRYVWDEASWEVLWTDILKLKKKKFSEENATHFTGPIVTRRIKGQQDRYEVIDGQQRLMTFQIIFCIIRDLCKPLKCCNLENKAIDHLKNSETDKKDFKRRDPMSENPDQALPDPDDKFIPSKYDKSAFGAIVNEEYGNEINDLYDIDKQCLHEDKIEDIRSKLFGDKTVSQNILDAYVYFYLKIRQQVQGETDDATCEKIDDLLEIIKSNFELVQIMPGDSQQAEEIFESVNATGRKLSEFDYLRNNLFLRAGDKSNKFYKQYWVFEEDPDGYDWDNDTLESFFQAFLMAKLGPDILNNKPKLFDIYRDIYRRKLETQEKNVKEEFKDLKVLAETYKKLDTDSEYASKMKFYADIGTYKDWESYNSDFETQLSTNITVIRAFIMYLQHGLEDTTEKKEILGVLDTLESYIVRRMLVDTVAGRYAYQSIKDYFRRCYKEEEKFCIGSMVRHFVEQSKRKWPSNNLVKDWFKKGKHEYQQGWLAQALDFTERYIFYRIENWYRQNEKQESLPFTKDKFPTYRNRLQTLPQLFNDRIAWGSMGNINYCYGGEARQGIRSFEDEKLFLKKHNNEDLFLNKEICQEDDWKQKQIYDREEKLLMAFCSIWRDSKGPWKNIEAKYKVGSIVNGSIVNIVSFGVFVELEPGINGLVHVSEIGWMNYEPEPSEVFSEGDMVTVKILDISETKQEISLSIKQTLPNPYKQFAEKNKVGSVVRGKIYNTIPYGGFAELAEGISGFIHISEIAIKPVKKPEEVLSFGDELELKVISLDIEDMKIGLSLKAVTWDNFIMKNKVGSIVRGKIITLADFGAFVEIEKGIEGLIHISELSNRRIVKPEDVVSVGEEIEAKVIKVDKEKMQIRLSLRALTQESSRKPAPRNRRVDKEPTLMGTRFKEAIKTKNSDKFKN